jgi:hypothetical protein
VNPVPVRGMLVTELIEAAGPRFSSLPPEAVTPLGTEDRTPVSPLDRLARCPVSLGSLDLPARAAVVTRRTHAQRLM